MIVLKTSRELSVMRKAGRISQKALRLAGEAVEPGVSAWEIDKLVRRRARSPAFLAMTAIPPARVFQ